MNSDAFTDRLKAAIGDISVRAFASKAGVSDTVVRQYLSGKSEPSRTVLLAMARAAGVTVSWLATGEGGMHPEDIHAGLVLDQDEYALVPRYDVQVSAGHGSLVENDSQPVESMAFRRDWIRKMGLSVSHLALVTARGDSMEPTLADGDLLLVDLRQSAITDGAIHVLRNDGNILVKRLQRGLGDQVIVLSDNKIYGALETTEAALNVVGRVFWRGGRM